MLNLSAFSTVVFSTPFQVSLIEPTWNQGISFTDNGQESIYIILVNRLDVCNDDILPRHLQGFVIYGCTLAY